MSSMPKEILKKYATNFEFYNQAKDRLDDKMFSNGLFIIAVLQFITPILPMNTP